MKNVTIAGLVIAGAALAATAGLAIASTTSTSHAPERTFWDGSTRPDDTAPFSLPVTVDAKKVVLNGVPINTPLASFAPVCKGDGHDATAPCWVLSDMTNTNDAQGPVFVEVKGLPPVKDEAGHSMVRRTLAVVNDDASRTINIVVVELDGHQVIDNDFRGVVALSKALGAPDHATPGQIVWKTPGGMKVSLSGGHTVISSNIPKGQ
ncbi:hypothetical protein [Paraburkholderia sp. BL21I4N1]|uniref:hypothetical protein n=1 Tax=Paraburkholderia sp. BL21I4N1 TaxID=1938801 RepID=UPI000CFC2385|nr:hypothetical protein [Paraburkholderia sp. BL21I4N1]PQV53311.1 hypothetical protein B0G83_102397 [Paraburkholderia sp. BL21I4N1]